MNTTAGYGFGAPTNYGFHEAADINGNGGGNADLGIPIHAIADGEVTSVHNHTTKPTFGNHIHYKIDGIWGTRYVHHAHCQTILKKVGDKVKEGEIIATIGNSGTEWAHDHFAIKKEPTGIDGIATTKELLKKWEDPIAFIEAQMNVSNDALTECLNMHAKLVDEGNAKDQLIKDTNVALETEKGKVKSLEDFKSDLAKLLGTDTQQSNILGEVNNLITKEDHLAKATKRAEEAEKQLKTAEDMFKLKQDHLNTMSTNLGMANVKNQELEKENKELRKNQGDFTVLAKVFGLYICTRK